MGKVASGEVRGTWPSRRGTSHIQVSVASCAGGQVHWSKAPFRRKPSGDGPLKSGLTRTVFSQIPLGSLGPQQWLWGSSSPQGPGGLTLCLLVWQMAERHGPVFTLHLGSSRVVVLYGYQAVREVLLQHKDDFSGRAEFFVMHQHKDKGTSLFLVPRWVRGPGRC